MANYDLDLQRYPSDHTRMWTALTNVSHAGYRYCRHESPLEHTITVKDGLEGPSCVLYLRENDLFLIGFKNGKGQAFGFGNQLVTVPNTPLSLTGHYSEVRDDYLKTRIDRDTLVTSLEAFHGYDVSSAGKPALPFLAMALLVSESMRFNSIFLRMQEVVKQRCSIALVDVYSKVTNWQDSTEFLHDRSKMPKLHRGPSQYNVRLPAVRPPFDPPRFAVQQHWHRLYRHDTRNQWLRAQVSQLFNEQSDEWRAVEQSLYGTGPTARLRKVQRRSAG